MRVKICPMWGFFSAEIWPVFESRARFRVPSVRHRAVRDRQAFSLDKALLRDYN